MPPKSDPHSSAASPDEFHGMRLTHPDRVIFKDQGITKRGLAEYYLAVADRLLPNLVNRPLSLVRCPGGASAPCFYQKQPPEGLSSSVRRKKIRVKDGDAIALYVVDIEGVLTLVQFGVLEIHTWQSHVKTVERPDQMVFDLNPGSEVPWSRIVDSANVLRDLLQELSLESFVKTTGGKGLHIVVPMEPDRNWGDVKQFCKGVAEALAQAEPNRYTTSMSKAQRPGKIFLDYLRNEPRGSTAVAAYSTRARANAPVSMPLDWKELPQTQSSNDFTLDNVLPLSKSRRDPWSNLGDVRQRISDNAFDAILHSRPATRKPSGVQTTPARGTRPTAEPEKRRSKSRAKLSVNDEQRGAKQSSSVKAPSKRSSIKRRAKK